MRIEHSNKKVLIIGYGSIGRRHAKNLNFLGIKPYILTKHPDNYVTALFFKDLSIVNNIEYVIISSPTASHLDDLKRCVISVRSLKKVLIEKPLESSYSKGKRLLKLIREKKLKAYVGYNLRFLMVFDNVKEFIRKNSASVRIVEAVAGQDLRQWRPNKPLSCSYSASRIEGGGVDLDLSHEIDYILWLFGSKLKKIFSWRAKISDLPIASPDCFKLILEGENLNIGICLDYIRPQKERYLKIICDNGKSLQYDFISCELKINGVIKHSFNRDEFNRSYIGMLQSFLDIGKNKQKLCSVNEALNVLKIIGV